MSSLSISLQPCRDYERGNQNAVFSFYYIVLYQLLIIILTNHFYICTTQAIQKIPCFIQIKGLYLSTINYLSTIAFKSHFITYQVCLHFM